MQRPSARRAGSATTLCANAASRLHRARLSPRLGLRNGVIVAYDRTPPDGVQRHDTALEVAFTATFQSPTPTLVPNPNPRAQPQPSCQSQPYSPPPIHLAAHPPAHPA